MTGLPVNAMLRLFDKPLYSIANNVANGQVGKPDENATPITAEHFYGWATISTRYFVMESIRFRLLLAL